MKNLGPLLEQIKSGKYRQFGQCYVCGAWREIDKLATTEVKAYTINFDPVIIEIFTCPANIECIPRWYYANNDY